MIVTVCCPVAAELDVVVGLPPHPLVGSKSIAEKSTSNPRCSIRRRRKPKASKGNARIEVRRRFEVLIRPAEVVRALTVMVLVCGWLSPLKVSVAGAKLQETLEGRLPQEKVSVPV